VFAVMMISDYRGEVFSSPLTFAFIACLLIVLMVLMAYSSKNKERFQKSEKKFFSCLPKEVETHLVSSLQNDGHRYNVAMMRDMRRVELTESGIVIRILPPHGSMTEVLVENLTSENERIASRLKASLDDAVLGPSSRLTLDHTARDDVRHT